MHNFVSAISWIPERSLEILSKKVVISAHTCGMGVGVSRILIRAKCFRMF